MDESERDAQNTAVHSWRQKEMGSGRSAERSAKEGEESAAAVL